MKKKILKAMTALLCVTCTCISLTSCGKITDKFKERLKIEESAPENNDTPSDSTPTQGENSSDNTDENGNTTTPEPTEDFPYYSGEGEVYQDETVYLNPEKATVHVGDTFRLQVITTDNSTPTYSYVNDSGKLISVDDRGNVTVLAAGTAYLQVSVSGSHYLITLTVIE